jgi:hypothetical protein
MIRERKSGVRGKAGMVNQSDLGILMTPPTSTDPNLEGSARLVHHKISTATAFGGVNRIAKQSEFMRSWL